MEKVVKAYDLPSEGQAEGMESIWERTCETFQKVCQRGSITLAANTADFVVRETTDLGKTTRRARPPGNGAEKTHTVLWWL